MAAQFNREHEWPIAPVRGERFGPVDLFAKRRRCHRLIVQYLPNGEANADSPLVAYTRHIALLQHPTDTVNNPSVALDS